MKKFLYFPLLALLPNFAAAETPCDKYLASVPPGSFGSAKSQREALWGLVAQGEYKKLPPLTGNERVLNLNPARTYPELMELRIRAFDVTGDIRPVQDEKMTHINGPAALARVVFNESPFTGIFSEGTRGVLLRTSFAFNPKNKSGPHDFPQPGLALKFFAEGVPTLNVLAMGSLDGEGSDGRYFSTPMATKLAAPLTTRGKMGEAIFSASTVDPGHLKLNHLSGIRPSGAPVQSPVTPEWIVFTPTELAAGFGKKEQLDFRGELLGIPPGTRIYEIRGALNNGNGKFKLIDLGYVETESKFVASEFADKKLHFHHEGARPSAGYQDYIRWQCGE